MRAGVEHEYRLWCDARQVDFRTLLPRVAEGLRALDPGDPRARRLPSGVALTADGWEAELATPPLDMGPGAARRIDDLLRAERTQLLAVGRTTGVDRLTGFSTHLNASVDDDTVVDVGRAFAEYCLPALAEVLEPAASSGLFVRPRRGRLELGGEYAEGPDLVAALVLYVACVDTLVVGSTPPTLAAPVLEPSREKFGWYAASLPMGQLGAVWAWARPAALSRGLDPNVLDGLASGARPLRRYRFDDPAACTLADLSVASVAPGSDLGRRVLASGVVAETEWLTWDHVVWLFTDPRGRTCRAAVPVAQEASFLTDLELGRYDELLDRMFRRRLRRLLLQRHAQLRDLTWWHELRPGALVPAERLPDGTAPASFGNTARVAYSQSGQLPARIWTRSRDRRTNGGT